MTTLHVSGMSCGHCVKAVTEAVNGVDPGATVRVDLPSGQVTVENGTAGTAQLTAAIEAEGYEVSR